MKKIIGILLAGALVTSAFAADANAKVRLTGSLVGFDGNNISALTLDSHMQEKWNPILDLAVSTDNAGAQIKFYNRSGTWDKPTENYEINDAHWNIWFKVLDLVKIQMGHIDIALNKEQIDWCESKSGKDSNGYGAEANIAGVNVALYFFPDWANSWISASGAGNSTRIGDVMLMGGYSMPFGTINGFFEYNGKNKVTKKVKTGEIKYALDEKTGTINATNPEKEVDWYDYNYMRFGLGYNSGSLLDGISFFVNVLGGINTAGNDVTAASYSGKFSNLTPELFGNFSFGAFNGKLFVRAPMSFIEKNEHEDGTVTYDKFGVHVFTMLKVQYALDMGITPYVYFKAPDWTDIPGNGLIIRPGVTGKVGIMDWEVQVEMNIAKAETPFSIKVPVILTVNF